MRCLYCGKRLAFLSKLTNGDFCSSAHRKRYQEDEERLVLARLLDDRRRTAHSLPVASTGSGEIAVPRRHSGHLGTAVPPPRSGCFRPHHAWAPSERPLAVYLTSLPGKAGGSRSLPCSTPTVTPGAPLALEPRIRHSTKVWAFGERTPAVAAWQFGCLWEPEWRASAFIIVTGAATLPAHWPVVSPISSSKSAALPPRLQVTPAEKYFLRTTGFEASYAESWEPHPVVPLPAIQPAPGCLNPPWPAPPSRPPRPGAPILGLQRCFPTTLLVRSVAIPGPVPAARRPAGRLTPGPLRPRIHWNVAGTSLALSLRLATGGERRRIQPC